MKITGRILKSVLAVFIVLAAALAVFRFNMINNGTIDTLGLYTDKAAGNLFAALVFTLIALTVIFAFIISKSYFSKNKPNVLWTLSAALCMLLLIASGISSFSKQFGVSDTVLSAYAPVPQKFDILLVIETVLLFASAVFFLTETEKCAKKSEKSNSILALLPVVYLALRAIRMFMNIETQINSSARSFTLLFLVVTMMFFLYEAEHSVPLGVLEKTDEQNAKRTAMYAGFGAVSAELAVIFVLAPMFAGGLSAGELMFGLSDLSLALFVAVRVFTLKNADNQ